MHESNIEWNPSWDDDWMIAQRQLNDELEEEHPRNPEQAVELYRYGFVAAHRQPPPDWSNVESELYQDYMSGSPEPGPAQTEDLDWEQSRSWAQRGYEASRL